MTLGLIQIQQRDFKVKHSESLLRNLKNRDLSELSGMHKNK